MIPTPPADQLREALRLIDAGRMPLPERLADAASYAVLNGCIDLDTKTLTDKGRRVLDIMSGGEG